MSEVRRRTLLNVVGVLLLVAWGNEILYGFVNAGGSRFLAIFAWIYFFIPALAFLFLRSQSRFHRIARWWPALGISFAVSLAQVAIAFAWANR